MSHYDQRLLLPPEEEEIYPYRRVWLSLVVESIALLLLTLGLYLLTTFVGFELPVAFHRPADFVIAIFPLALWFVFSFLQERGVLEPRQRLLAVVILSALVANAIAVPFIENFLQVDRWLPSANALTRILGYTFTVGIIQEFLKYLVIRYTVWPDCLRTRLDAVAYGLASAVGYATVVNLHDVLSNTPLPNMASLDVFNTTVIQYAGSIILAYGLAETRFGRPTPLLLTLTLALAATLTGIAIPLRAGLVNADLSLTVSAPSPLMGLGFSAALLTLVIFVISFLIQNAERQEREAAGKEV